MLVVCPDLNQLLAKYPDDISKGEDYCPYVMGWTLIPPNVMNDFDSFMPVDAFDCCSKRGLAQGVLAVRATKNADERIQLISISDLIGPESSLTMEAVMHAEASLLASSPSAIDGKSPYASCTPSHPLILLFLFLILLLLPYLLIFPASCVHSLNAQSRVCIMDGSKSEVNSQLHINPLSNVMSCSFHLTSELVKKGVRGFEDKLIFEQLLALPPGHIYLADLLYAKLSKNSFLRNIPKEQLCPAYLPENVCTHGNTTSNMAEVTHGTFEAVRPVRSLFRSLKLTVDILKLRQDALRADYLYHLALAHGKQSVQMSMSMMPTLSMVPPNVQKKFNDKEALVAQLGAPYLSQSNFEGEEQQVIVPSPKGTFCNSYIVRPTLMNSIHFAEVCTCGGVATHELFCKHVQRSLTFMKADWRLFIKPWSMVSGVSTLTQLAPILTAAVFRCGRLKIGAGRLVLCGNHQEQACLSQQPITCVCKANWWIWISRCSLFVDGAVQTLCRTPKMKDARNRS